MRFSLYHLSVLLFTVTDFASSVSYHRSSSDQNVQFLSQTESESQFLGSAIGFAKNLLGFGGKKPAAQQRNCPEPNPADIKAIVKREAKKLVKKRRSK